MLRKTIIALTAFATLGGAALAPSAASAHGFRFHHHGFGWGFYGARYFAYAPSNCYWVKKFTPFGVRLVKVCSW